MAKRKRKSKKIHRKARHHKHPRRASHKSKSSKVRKLIARAKRREHK